MISVPPTGRFCAVFVAAVIFSFRGNAQFENLLVEKVSGQFGYPDGIAWVKDGYLVIADVLTKKLLRFNPGEKGQILRENDGGVQGIAADAMGRLYLCEAETRSVRRIDRRGNAEVLADKFAGKRLNSPNDIVVRKDGVVYFTDPAFGKANEKRELDFYGVFRIDPKGAVETVAQWKTRPNGIGLTQDGKTLYVTDSDRHAVVAFDIDRAGAASNERIAVKGIEGVPGGIRTDVHGRLYVAARNLDVFEPTGKQVYRIPLAEPATNCAFGQDNLQSLFISTRKSLYRAQLNVKGAAQY